MTVIGRFTERIAELERENAALAARLADAQKRSYAVIADLMPRGEGEWTGAALNGRVYLRELRAAIDAARESK